MHVYDTTSVCSMRGDISNDVRNSGTLDRGVKFPGKEKSCVYVCDFLNLVFFLWNGVVFCSYNPFDVSLRLLLLAGLPSTSYTRILKIIQMLMQMCGVGERGRERTQIVLGQWTKQRIPSCQNSPFLFGN